MTSNHEEWSSDVTLESLKCSVQTYWDWTYHCRKNKEHRLP